MIKLLLLPLLMSLYASETIASDTTIVMRKVSYSEVFELAKKENKAVLLYFHFDGCGACKKMEKTTFVNQDVASFYNKNFVCLEVNTLNEEGIEINKIYNVQMHPTFLFLDANARELHKIVGIFSPEEFILQGENVLNPVKNLASFHALYDEGKRDADFLLEYCYMLRDANELDSTRINDYLRTQSESVLNSKQNILFLYEFAIHKGKPSFSRNSVYYKFIENNKNSFTAYFDQEQVKTRLMFIVMDDVYKAIDLGDINLFNETIEQLGEFDTGNEYAFREMDDRITFWTMSNHLVLSAELTYYEKNGPELNYHQTLDRYLEKIWNDSEALNSFAWETFEQSENKYKLEKSISSVRRSIELDNNYANNDTYAWLLYKTGEKKKAHKQAEIAIELAKKSNEEYSETSKLIELIEE